MTDPEHTLSTADVENAVSLGYDYVPHEIEKKRRAAFREWLSATLAAEREAGRREGAVQALTEAANELHQFSGRDDGFGGYLCRCGGYRWTTSEPHCPERGELLARAEKEADRG